ncbi:MAG: hypothetical protein K6L75_13620 [Cellvibrionaceae bacterium]
MNTKYIKHNHKIRCNNIFCKAAKCFIPALAFLFFSVQGFTQVLSNIAYKPISSAQEAMTAEDYPLAIQTLNALLTKGDKLKPFDKAKTLQLIAISNINLEKIPAAIKASERALATEALDSVSSSQMRFTLFNLYSMQENYPSAIDHIEKWFQSETMPNTQAYFSAARIYALAEQWESALKYAKQGMMMLSSSQQDETSPSISPQSSWYNLLVAIQLQLKLFDDARFTLENAISLWPNKAEYYRQLSGIYQELERGKDSFAILSLAYQNNLLSTANDFERLSQQYRFLEHPFKGAQIHEIAQKNKIIKDNEKFWSTLSDTLLQAREWDRAEKALTQAAQLSTTGKHWLTLCKTSFQNEKWNHSLELCNNALSKGGLGNDTSEAWQFIALAKYRKDDLNGAKSAFDRCLTNNKNNNRCRTWQEHIAKTQIARKKELEETTKQNSLKKEKQKKLNNQLDRALLIGDGLSSDSLSDISSDINL